MYIIADFDTDNITEVHSAKTGTNKLNGREVTQVMVRLGGERNHKGDYRDGTLVWVPIEVIACYLFEGESAARDLQKSLFGTSY